MFGIGGQELVLLMLIGLIVLGPERLPRIANQIGGWLGQARRMTRVMKRQLEEELLQGNRQLAAGRDPQVGGEQVPGLLLHPSLHRCNEGRDPDNGGDTQRQAGSEEEEQPP